MNLKKLKTEINTQREDIKVWMPCSPYSGTEDHYVCFAVDYVRNSDDELSIYCKVVGDPQGLKGIF